MTFQHEKVEYQSNCYSTNGIILSTLSQQSVFEHIPHRHNHKTYLDVTRTMGKLTRQQLEGLKLYKYSGIDK
jgi:hypothetical protein